MSCDDIGDACTMACDGDSGNGKSNGGGIGHSPLEPPSGGWPSQKPDKCDEHSHTLCRVMRAEEDNARLLAAIRQADSDSRGRDDGLHTLTTELMRIQGQILETLRHVQDDQYAIKRHLELVNAG